MSGVKNVQDEAAETSRTGSWKSEGTTGRSLDLHTEMSLNHFGERSDQQTVQTTDNRQEE